MDLNYVKELIQILEKSGLSRITIKEKNGVEITLEKEKSLFAEPMPMPLHKTQQPMLQHVVDTAPKKLEVTEEIDEKKCVKSPMVGTFYRSENPDSKPFKEVGDEVSPGDILCIIEAMKVMNEIKSGLKGKVKKILVGNGEPVEYGQILFVVE